MSVVSRGTAAIIGAAVADAASLGLHWVYSLSDLEKAVKGPLGTGGEFLPPVATYHKLRTSGQCTMYGEGLLCMARSLASTKGVFSPSSFVNEWKATFGLGGTYVGYCDGVIKGTLFNYMKTANENEKHTYPPSDVTPEARPKLYMGVKTAAETLSGAELEARVTVIASEVGAPQAIPWAVTAGHSWEKILRGSIAIDDSQSNTLGKVIPLAVAAAGRASFDADIEAGIRVTQCSAVAVAYHTFCARLVEAAVLGRGGTPGEVVEAALACTQDEKVCAVVREAVTLGGMSEGAKATSEVYAHFGAACAATSTVPLLVFMLVRHGGGGFESAVRFNLMGESAARACVIGAVLGALGGKAPEAWVAKLSEGTRGELLDLAPKVAAFAGGGAGASS